MGGVININDTLKIIIAGSRDFDNYDLLEETMSNFLKENTNNVEIVSGTARGADRLGEKFAENHGYQVKRFPANWNLYGKSAGPIRNRKMAEYASEGHGILFVFWDGASKGTKNMIDLAEKYGLEVHVINFKELRGTK